jgi:HAD superfamily hydrolase (TIGR01490 family)
VETKNNSKTIAVFDFDGTLTKGDSFWRFLFFSTGFFKVFAAGMSKFFLMWASIFAPHKYADDAKEYLIDSLLGNRQLDEMQKLANDFARKIITSRLKYPTVQRLRFHQMEGHEILVISASPSIYVTPACKLLGITNVIATELKIVDGNLTGKYLGKNCRGPEKARRLEEFCGQFNKVFIYAYGNSGNDKEMLEYADIGIRVDRTDVSTPLNI